MTGPAVPTEGAEALPAASPAGMTDVELRVRLTAAVRRRLSADEEPEHTCTGDRLLVLLHEARRRNGGTAA